MQVGTVADVKSSERSVEKPRQNWALSYRWGACRGGMGEVHRAQDVRLGRTVAVKVLSHSADQREDIRQRFEREARVLSSLNHPNILRSV
ncbi:MAG: protein kinase [Bryobacteraceae bacterium]